MIIKIVVIGIIAMTGFTAGAVWLNVKQTRKGKKANYNCDDCDAEECQAKWCKIEKEKKNNVRK